MIVMYGIKNCNTVKKARRWLEDHNIEYEFHDYKKDGIDAKKLREYTKEFGWETLLNRKGTTWRKLPDEVKENVNQTKAIKIMLENSSVIKRPLIDTGKKQIVGFNEEDYEAFFA